ncbi:MAG: hypothetical protein ABEJ56_02145 [Candidatus Nanohaloarchaea archaeon]
MVEKVRVSQYEEKKPNGNPSEEDYRWLEENDLIRDGNTLETVLAAEGVKNGTFIEVFLHDIDQEDFQQEYNEFIEGLTKLGLNVYVPRENKSEIADSEESMAMVTAYVTTCDFYSVRDFEEMPGRGTYETPDSSLQKAMFLGYPLKSAVGYKKRNMPDQEFEDTVRISDNELEEEPEAMELFPSKIQKRIPSSEERKINLISYGVFGDDDSIEKALKYAEEYFQTIQEVDEKYNTSFLNLI